MESASQTVVAEVVMTPSSEQSLVDAKELPENATMATAPDNNQNPPKIEVTDDTSVDQSVPGARDKDRPVPSGTNVSTDRDYTVTVGVPPVLYKLEWMNRRHTPKKPAFYSSTPFTNLRIVKETVAPEYREPVQIVEKKSETGKKKKHQPIFEVITELIGTAARDKPKPPSGKPVNPAAEPIVEDLNDEPKLPQVPVPYRLEEIAIQSIGSTRIYIHSELLLRALKSIITYYPEGMTRGRIDNDIYEPFKILFHYRDEIKAFSTAGNTTYNLPNDNATQDQTDEVRQMIEHSKVLMDFVEPRYQEFMDNAGDRLSNEIPLVQFDELWYLFQPGIDVYFQKDDGKVTAGVVISTDISFRHLKIKVWYLMFDGTVLKRKASRVDINYYVGEEEITTLDTYPCKYWDRKDGGKRRKAFESRGETIFRLCQNRHKQVFYRGKLPDDGDELFKGLVIIDNDPIKNLEGQDVEDDKSSSGSGSRPTRSPSPTVPNWGGPGPPPANWPGGPPPHRGGPPVIVNLTRRRRRRSFSSGVSDSEPDDDESVNSGSESRSESEFQVGDDEGYKQAKKQKSTFKWANYKNLNVESQGLTKHHYFLFDPYITGFAVLTKKWKKFDIDFVSEVPKREDMIDSVVMEATKQEIIKAISHPQNRVWKLDFIQGKGEGQIILLHGPPGVGKTYTVECAAEATGRPLILLTIADIGLDEKKIEEQMTKWFNLAERWEAILLIDEADIFLERRRGADIARNGLVSVFLRKMEYFQGLLFLTTNRIGQIDDAFLSRVHVVIGYTPLDEPKRKRIWNGFFRNLQRDMAAPSRDGPKIEVSKYAKEYVLNDDEVKALKWNGREIRNAFQTAISLAGYEAAKDPDWTTEKTINVQKDHFSSVVMMSREFHSYMDSITEQAESERARARFERNDAHMLG